MNRIEATIIIKFIPPRVLEIWMFECFLVLCPSLRILCPTHAYARPFIPYIPSFSMTPALQSKLRSHYKFVIMIVNFIVGVMDLWLLIFTLGTYDNNFIIVIITCM